jgi:hypothetical protein
MDPLAVIRTIWRMKWFAFPAIILTVAAAVAVYFYGPRTYESTISYALVNPKIPTEAELELNPSLVDLNADNPYLRSSDPNLVANVVITRLNAPGTQEELKRQGLGTEFLATPGAGGGGLIVSITASGETEAQSLATIRELGTLFEESLHSVQTINGADERFLFTPIVVAEPDRATEKLSSRVRTVIMVSLAGVILIFGSISLGTWVESSRKAHRARKAEAKAASEAEAEAASETDAKADAEPDATAHAPTDAKAEGAHGSVAGTATGTDSPGTGDGTDDDSADLRRGRASATR